MQLLPLDALSRQSVARELKKMILVGQRDGDRPESSTEER